MRKPSTTRSLKDIKSTTSIDKRSAKQSVGSIPSKPRAKKEIVGKTRSQGTVSGAEYDKDKRHSKVSRSASLNTSVVAKKSSQSSTEIARKKLTPLRSDHSKQKLIEEAFTITKSEQPKKSTQTRTDKKEIPSKSFSHTTQTEIARKTSTPLRNDSKQKFAEKAFTIVKSERKKSPKTRTDKKEITSKSFSHTTQTSNQKHLNLNKRKAALSQNNLKPKEEPFGDHFIKQVSYMKINFTGFFVD